LSFGFSRTFSRDYFTARERFRKAAQDSGFTVAAYPIAAPGPEGQQLYLDVARKGAPNPRQVVVVSSGTHGIEGFFGSAVQLCALQRRLSELNLPEHMAVVLIHAVNPYGFAWQRRVNEDNIDLNRNFLLTGRDFAGAPEGYRALDPLLNPKSPPSLLEPFWAKAGVEIARHGFSSLKNAIAQGQYEFPGGLFYGGHGPSQSQEIMRAHLRDWLGSPERVLHVDLHTGLGPWGSYKLGVDMSSSDPRVKQLAGEFGEKRVTGYDPSGILYEIQGGLGPWLEERMAGTQYDCLLAEFGTYPSPMVLGALRTENRSHHYAREDAITLKRAKKQLHEVFCPSSRVWRRVVALRGLRVVNRALDACH
jgi:hypothetical protein